MIYYEKFDACLGFHFSILVSPVSNIPPVLNSHKVSIYRQRYVILAVGRVMV
jgi:hypothetical protein